MPSIFWTGKLTFPMRLMVNTNNLLALAVGNATNTGAMKSRVRQGYEASFSDHVERYDELGLDLQDRSAEIQLRELQLAGQSVLDIGCGTGVVALQALRAGARDAVCGDISMHIMEPAKDKVLPKPGSLRFTQLDAEDLPFADDSFHAVLSGMSFGLFPDQRKALREMIRVAKPGGLICIGAHGPEHYWEAIDGWFRCISKRRVLGYRLEFWPRSEAYLRRLLSIPELQDLRSHREAWQTRFPSGGAMYDFFAAVTALWWYANFPAREVVRESQRTRAYFERTGLDTITDDVIAVWGRKVRAAST
jgi:ubiquinone/menaquinone biosynthesis C-methylase UbiE